METRTKYLISTSFVILAVSLVFFLMIYQPGTGMYIRADKLQNPPEKYIEFSSADIEKYPYVEEAIKYPGKNIKVPSEYHENVLEFGKISSNNDANYIKVNNEYYWIHYFSAD